MLYRLRPPGMVEVWRLGPSSLAGVPYGSDLDSCAWVPSTEVVFSDELLGAALRHGQGTGVGVVLAGTEVSTVVRPQQLQKMFSANSAAVQQATQQLQALLSSPAKPQLEQHWLSLGGDLPDGE